MALSNNEKSILAPVVAREGLDSFLDQVRQAAITDRKASAAVALGNSVSVTVSDWSTPAAYVAQANNTTLASVIADIGAAWTAKDQSKLGALFVQLYAASKAHLGL